MAGDRDSRVEEPRNRTPRRYPVSSAVDVPDYAFAPSSDVDREPDGGAYSEAETDGEDDDEPTIRPANSCASSETQSLYSNDASEDADDNEEEEVVSFDERSVERGPRHRRWTSVDDRPMASP